MCRTSHHAVATVILPMDVRNNAFSKWYYRVFFFFLRINMDLDFKSVADVSDSETMDNVNSGNLSRSEASSILNRV